MLSRIDPHPACVSEWLAIFTYDGASGIVISPSPDINRKIEESKNRSWVCPSPTFDFLTIIQTEIKKSKNRRIEESQIEVEVVTTDRRRSEFIYFSATVSNLLPPPPLLRLSSFHCVCEQITLLLRLLSPLKPSQTLT